MEQVTIQAEKRDKLGKGSSRQLRREGKIPAIFYGKGVKENLHLTVKTLDLDKAVSGEKGMNVLIQLKVDGEGEFNVFLRDYQADALLRKFVHADFVNVDLKEKIHIKVPIVLTGRCIGVKEGGILDQTTRELDLVCMPTNVPTQIEVDISALAIGENLHVSDIQFPEGSEYMGQDSNITIASVTEPKAEKEPTAEEAAAVDAEASAEPEVLTEKKVEGTKEETKK